MPMSVAGEMALAVLLATTVPAQIPPDELHTVVLPDEQPSVALPALSCSPQSSPEPFSGRAPRVADNTHYVDANDAGIEPPLALTPIWAMEVPGGAAKAASALPAGDALLLSSAAGEVYALDRESGCIQWLYSAGAQIVGGLTVASRDDGEDDQSAAIVFFGDARARVHALDFRSGARLWVRPAGEHPSATIVGRPVYHDGRLFVPLASTEKAMASHSQYSCCSFRGSLVALDVAEGTPMWRHYLISEPPVATSSNAAGVMQQGPSGAAVVGAPAVDATRGQIYLATGPDFSSPAQRTSNAIVAVSMETGEAQWAYSLSRANASGSDCDALASECPEEGENGAVPAMLATAVDGTQVVIAARRGVVHAVSPDDGTLIWRKRLAPTSGGIGTALAADNEHVYVPVFEGKTDGGASFPPRPGLHALSLLTGQEVWFSPSAGPCMMGDASCLSGIVATPVVTDGMVIAADNNGLLVAYATADGAMLESLDMRRSPMVTLDGGTIGGGRPMNAAPAVRAGQIFVTIDAGQGRSLVVAVAVNP